MFHVIILFQNVSAHWASVKSGIPLQRRIVRSTAWHLQKKRNRKSSIRSFFHGKTWTWATTCAKKIRSFQAKGGSSSRSSAKAGSQAGPGLYLGWQAGKLEVSMTCRERGLKSNSWLMKGRIKRSFEGYERLYQWIFQRCQAAFKISFRRSLQNGWSVAMDNLPRIGLEWFKT